MGEKVKVLMLGTYHFDKGGAHLIDFNAGDMATCKKQDEIKEVVQKLMEFKPNKIAVEANRKKEKELNMKYSEFCTDNSIQSNDLIGCSNEIVQIAFRLGYKLNHNKIYPVDVPVNLPEDVFEYAEKNSPDFIRNLLIEQMNMAYLKMNS